MDIIAEFREKLMAAYPRLATENGWQDADSYRRYRQELDMLDREWMPKDIQRHHARAAVLGHLKKLEIFLNLL